MKYIVIVLMSLCLLSCNKSVDIRKICIDKTKDELNNKGVPVLSIDTVVASKPINSRDSFINVLCKVKEGYYVTESIIHQDTIKQFILLASGTKEHCMSYIKYGFYGNKYCICYHCVDIRNYESKHPSYRETGRIECLKGCEHGY